MLRKITVVLERKDYVALFMLLVNKKLVLFASLPLLIAIPVGAVLLGYIASQAGFSLAMLLLPYIVLILAMLLILFRALIAPALKQFKQAQAAFGNSFTFLLESEGFVCAGGKNEAQYDYARLDKALETKDYIFLFVNAEQACIFPKRLLSADELAFLQNLLPKCASLPANELTNEFEAVAGSAEKKHDAQEIELDSTNDPLA